MATYRLYLDESGDHTYKHLDAPGRRYLGLTGVLIHNRNYNPSVPERLEELKKQFFTYDPDDPPILVRRRIIDKKSGFWVLRNPDVNREWETAILQFLADLRAQIFTVVMDKQEHLERFPSDAWNPYTYCLNVLLDRVRGYLSIRGDTTDVMPESRGQAEDNQLLAAYVNLLEDGSNFATKEQYQAVFPVGRLLFRKKDHNVAGLQIADLIAADQKKLTVLESDGPDSMPIGAFGEKLNHAVGGKVNRYGRYLLS